MNQNVLISTALISSLWDSQHKDTLDLIMPFLKYSISKNTSVGNKLNIDDIANFFKAEFGYESIPRNVLLAMLERLSPNILKKEHRSFYLVAELDEEIVSFEKRRTLYKEHRESVGNALALYLNDVVLKLKQPYNCETALLALINFFVKKGLVVARNTEQLIIVDKDEEDKVFYSIARFIVEENKKGSSVFDYIIDMVKGFFVTTVISFQPQNYSLPNTKLKELCCYLDTRIVINALGMHLLSEQQAAIELIDMLKTEQAKIYCFEHTVQEIREAIKAYRNDLYYSGRKRKYKTFEQWDEQGYTVERVSRFLMLLENKIKDLNIEIIPTPARFHTRVKGLYFHTFKEQLDKIPYHSQQAREYDMLSMLSVMHLRQGYISSALEKCGHIFITTNTPLVAASNLSLKDSIDSVPPLITDATISSIMWVKCGNSHQDYPKQKLLENAMLALEPTKSLLDKFYTQIDQLLAEGGISEEEAEIVCTDIYIKRELNETVGGDVSRVDKCVVNNMRESLKSKLLGETKVESDANYQNYIQQKLRNDKTLAKIISNIEEAGDTCLQTAIKVLNILINTLLIFVFMAFIGFTIASFVMDNSFWIGAIVLLAINLVSGYDLIFSKRKMINRLIFKISNQFAERKREKKKAEYKDILDSLKS